MQDDGWIEDIAGAICDPIIVYPAGGWEQDLPQPLKQRLPMDRLAHNMACLKGKASRDECCDTEALLYMYPRCMMAPLGDQWTRIYLYLGTRVMGKAAPEEFQKKHAALSDQDMQELTRLKRWIQQKKVEARRTRMCGEKAAAKADKRAAAEETVQHAFKF